MYCCWVGHQDPPPPLDVAYGINYFCESQCLSSTLLTAWGAQTFHPHIQTFVHFRNFASQELYVRSLKALFQVVSTDFP